MKINEITVSYKATVVMRRFETVEIFVSAKAELAPNDHFDTSFRKLYKQVESEVESQVKKKKIERKESYDDEMEKSE